MRITAYVATPAIRAWYRALAASRGISLDELACAMGYSGARSLNSRLSGKRSAPSGRIVIAVEFLDRLEDAITAISDARGGVHAASGSTPEGVDELRRMLTNAREGVQ